MGGMAVVPSHGTSVEQCCPLVPLREKSDCLGDREAGRVSLGMIPKLEGRL